MFEKLLLVLYLIAVVNILFCIWLSHRNIRVYTFRTNLIENDWDTYKKLPTYESMVWKFWVWDLNKFVRNEGEE